jgi:tetratricopeptide (TPR) repeat protein
VLSGECLAQAPQARPARGGVAKTETADRPEATSLPPVPDSIEHLLAAPYLTDDQKADKRIFFGRYTAADLNSPARVARAALMRGAIDDPSLKFIEADPLDRAEAAYLRGDLDAALAILHAIEKPNARAIRIAAAILEDQGHLDEAVHAGEPVLLALGKRQLTTAEDITEAVRIAAQHIRLRGPSGNGGAGAGAAGDFKALIAILDDVTNRIDRLYWPALVFEAELLAARDSKQDSIEALTQAAKLNPASARTWELIALRMVESFTFGPAEGLAKRMDLIAGEWAGEDPDPLPDAIADADPGTVSPDAAMIVARMYLRQSEGAQALKILEPMLARFPHSPRLLALKCAAQAVAFDFDAANASLDEYDRQFNNSPVAQYETGRALSESRQYAQSRIHLEEAANRLPTWPEPHIELGLMLMQAGKDNDAIRALERAFALDPFNARADNTLRLARELQTYERIETPHYIIRCKPGLNTDGTVGDSLLAREMAAPLEANYAIVTGSQSGGIDFQVPDKTIIDLLPDHKWFGVRIAGMPAIHTIAASTGPLIAMESPRDGPNHLGPYDWVRVLRHEFTHTVTLARTKNRIPHWFTEASAVNLELAPRDYNVCQLLAGVHKAGKLFDFTTINLAFIRPKKPTDRTQAYMQGAWMYEYIIARAGPKAPLDLMDKYAAGVREEEAFHSVLGISRAEFLDGFLEWSRQQLIDWGMEVPDGTPTIRQLLAREALQNPGGNAGAGGATEAPPSSPAPTPPNPPTPDEAAAKIKAEAERTAALHRIIDNKATDDDDDVELPEATPELVAKWLVQYPKHPDLLELTMDAAVEKNDGKATPEIAPLIERYAAARPVDPKPHRLLARMYLAQADADPAALAAEAAKAIPHLEFLDQREQKTATYAMELARRYAATGEMARATAKAERATQIDPFNPRPRELAATIAIQAKDFATAERHIRALTLIEPDREIHKQRLEALEKLREQAK